MIHRRNLPYQLVGASLWMAVSTLQGSTAACADTVTTGRVETLIRFERPTASPPPLPPYTYNNADTPASIVLDGSDNIYMSLGFSGRICKVNSNDRSGCEWTVQLPIFEGPDCNDLPGPFPWPVVLGIAMEEDDDDALYVAVNACWEENHGVWRVDTHNGSAEMLRRFPHGKTLSPDGTCLHGGGIVVNGLAARDGYIYAADYFCFRIWRFRVQGNQPPTVWSSDPLMLSLAPWPGPNGLRFHGDDLYVSLSGGGKVLKFLDANNVPNGVAYVHVHLPLHPCCDEGNSCGQLEGRLEDALPGNGAVDICRGPDPGTGEVIDLPMGCDEFDFDKDFDNNGIIICTTDPYNVVVLLDPCTEEPITQVLFDGRHPSEGASLDGPTSAAFGRTSGARSQLYITNGAFPILPPPIGQDRNPSLMVVDVEIS